MQKKVKKVLSACTMASILITSSAVSMNVKAETVTPPESPRLWGADRYETAVKVSQAGWESGSDYAIIASGEGYADALCATPLAKANNAPILLTQKDTLNQNTINELKRLKVKQVYIVGGQGVVSSAIESKIKAEIGSTVERLWGQNRYETAVKVAEKLGTVTNVVLASGEGYADALSAAPLAAIKGMPILLTEKDQLSQAASNYIKAKAVTKTYVIGGYASISNNTMNSVPSPERLGGSDRYETNCMVINAFEKDFDFSKIYIALGNGPVGNEFADALTGSALAAKTKNPLVITGKELSSSTEKLLKAKLATGSTITVLGGVANVSDSLYESVKSMIPKDTTNNSGSISGSGGGGSVTTPKVVKNWVEDMVSVIAHQPSISDKITVKQDTKTGAVSLSLTDAGKAYANKSVSELYSDVLLNKIANTQYNSAKINAAMNQMNKIMVDGKSAKDYLITKLEGKPNCDTAVAFLKNQDKASYEALQNKLKDQATYDEILAVLKDSTLVKDSYNFSNVKIGGVALNKIVIGNETIEAGKTYSIDQVKATLGLATKNTSDIKYSDLKGKSIKLQFGNKETITLNIN